MQDIRYLWGDVDCGRRFGSEAELKAHAERRHKL